MNKLEIMNNLTRVFHKTSFQIKKHSPEILLTAGVIGTVASAVLACKATTKLSGILEETKEHTNAIHTVIEEGTISKEEYSEEDARKDLAIVYVQTGIKLAKLYAPSIALGVLSITGILASNNIMRKRNVALAAAYTVADQGFKDYRGRLIERFGEELDRELKYNLVAREVEETIIDEKGKEKKVKKTQHVVSKEGASRLSMYSDYARFFDDGCTGWEKDSEFNLMYLRHQQNYANDLLRSKGHLFLNEVYDMLGIPRTKAGQVVGWVYDEDNPSGDNYVDFGIFDIYKEGSRDFVNGYERTILLDFNVDGNILDLL